MSATILAADDARHGTPAGYKDCRCRCGACRRAVARAANIYLMRRAAKGGRHLTVDKMGSVRRLQALMALGWPRRELAARAGYQGDAFALILNGRRQRLFDETARRIEVLYDRLCMTPGPSNSGRIRAAKKGWPPPLAWDDIDDPDETPREWEYRVDDLAVRHEALDDMLARGASLSEACRVLDISTLGLEKWCDRNGRRPDYNRLVAWERGAA